MMHVLLESAAPAPTRLMSWTSASVVTHGVIVAGALWLTLAPTTAPGASTEAEPLIYVRPDLPPPPRPPLVPIPSAGLARLGTVTVPPVAVPRITFPEYVPSFASSAFPATSIFGDPVGTSTTTDPERVRAGHEVEHIVRPRAGNPQPEYPTAMRSAGVEGEVLVRFVVDTLGRVEPRSVEVRAFTHALFADAVRDWLRRTRYDPASIAGRPVRQLVEQRVGFTLRR